MKPPLHSSGDASRLNGVAPRTVAVRGRHMVNKLPRRALSAGRLTALGATRVSPRAPRLRRRYREPQHEHQSTPVSGAVRDSRGGSRCWAGGRGDRSGLSGSGADRCRGGGAARHLLAQLPGAGVQHQRPAPRHLRYADHHRGRVYHAPDRARPGRRTGPDGGEPAAHELRSVHGDDRPTAGGVLHQCRRYLHATGAGYWLSTRQFRCVG